MKTNLRTIDYQAWCKALLIMAALLGLFIMGNAHAADATSGTVGEVAENIKDSFSSLAKLITAGAYIAGMGFVLGAIFKFKAHKDNPTQIPIGTPIALLFIGAAMIFLPQIFEVSGTTIFGSSATVGSVEGVDEFGSFKSK